MNTPTPSRRKASKKPYIYVGALFIYMCAVAIYNIKTVTENHDYLRYFGTLAAEVAILVILFFVLRRRERLKQERKDDLERAERERKQMQSADTENKTEE